MKRPKNFLRDTNYKKEKIGVERREELLRRISDNAKTLPRGIYYEDMDKSFLTFTEKDLDISIQGKKVPVHLFSIQRFSEFMMHWETASDRDQLEIPLVTVVRKPDAQVGTNQGSFANIPGFPTFTYCEVPKVEDGKIVVDIYSIPQPVPVDLHYEVRFFCHRMRDLNRLNTKVIKTFSSKQFYIDVFGHPMPITLDSVGDESVVDTIDKRRYYAQSYSIILKGYILDEEDFKVVRKENKALISTEIDRDVNNKRFRFVKSRNRNFIGKCGGLDERGSNILCPICLEVDFNRRIPNNCTIISTEKILFDSSNHKPENYNVKLNGVDTDIPFKTEDGDTIDISTNLTGVTKPLQVRLCGREIIGDPIANTSLSLGNVDAIGVNHGPSLDSTGSPNGSNFGCHVTSYTLQSPFPVTITISGETGEALSVGDIFSLGGIEMDVDPSSTYDNVIFSKNPSSLSGAAYDILVSHSYSDDCLVYSNNPDISTIPTYFYLGFDNHVPKVGPTTTGYPIGLSGLTLQDEPINTAFRMMPQTRSPLLSSEIQLQRIMVSGVDYFTSFNTELSSDTDPQFFADDITTAVKSTVSNQMPQLIWGNTVPNVAHLLGMAFSDFTFFSLEELEFEILDHNDISFISEKFFITVDKHLHR